MEKETTPQPNGFDIQLLNQDKSVFGTQHISVAQNSSNITFTAQGSPIPVAVINSDAKTFSFSQNGKTISVDISKIAIDHTETLTFTVNTPEGTSTFKIDGNSISQKKQGEKAFTPVVVFDQPLDIELPTNLPEQISKGDINVKAFPSQMLDTLKNSYGYSSYESQNGKLKLLKNQDGEILALKGNKIIPIQKAHYIDKGNNEAVLGLITTKSKGVIKRGSTSGIGYELNMVEALQVAEFIEGQKVDQNIFLQNANEQILDFGIVPKSAEATKKATDMGSDASPKPVPVKPDPHPVPPALPPKKDEGKNTSQPNNKTTGTTTTPTTTPSKPEDKPEAKKEDKKEDKKPEVKKTELITTSLAFLIACLTFGLLIAGIGVAGWLVPAICATSSAIAMGGGGVLTLHYIDEKQPKKSKEQKQKEKQEKKLQKQKKKEARRNKKAQKENGLTKPGRVIAKDYIPTENQQTELTQLGQELLTDGNGNSRTVKKPTVTTDSNEISTDNIQELSLAIQTAKQSQGTPEYDKNVQTVIENARQINPQNDYVLNFSGNNQKMVQACIDAETAYTAYTSVSRDYETASASLETAIQNLKAKPTSKSAQKEYEACAEAVKYNEDLLNRAFTILNEKIDVLNNAVNDVLNTRVSNTTEPTNTTTTQSAEQSLTERAQPIDKIISLNDTFVTLQTSGKKTTFEDYQDVVKQAQEIIEELDKKVELTEQEQEIMSICKTLAEQDSTRIQTEEDIKKLTTELEKLDVDDPETRDDHKIEEVRQQITSYEEGYKENLNDAKQTVAMLSSAVSQYVGSLSNQATNTEENEK